MSKWWIENLTGLAIWIVLWSLIPNMSIVDHPVRVIAIVCVVALYREHGKWFQEA